MKESLDEIKIKLLKDFVRSEFPKKRIRTTRVNKSKRTKINPHFKKVIIVPSTLNQGNQLIFNVGSKSDTTQLGSLFMVLFRILQNFFYGFEIELINRVLYEYLGLTKYL